MCIQFLLLNSVGNLVGEVQDLLLYKCKFLLGMAKEAEKDKQIAEEEEEEEEYVLLELDDVHYSCIQPNAPYILSVSWFHLPVCSLLVQKDIRLCCKCD